MVEESEEEDSDYEDELENYSKENGQKGYLTDGFVVKDDDDDEDMRRR